MLAFFSVVIMLIVAYAHFREGIFTAALMFINVFLAGLVTFNFYEPVAEFLDTILYNSFLSGYEDIFVLTCMFAGTLALLRAVTNNLSPTMTEFPGAVHQLGGGLFGLATGYLVSGFIVCALETLPWHENFMNFEPRAENEAPIRTILPPDRVWLALMRQAGAYAFAWTEEKGKSEAESNYDRYLTFDPDGTFEIRYQRYRRYGDKRDPSVCNPDGTYRYEKEFDRELRK